MKTPTILLCSLLGIVAALPNGNYHVESNYKSSSSSFRNNELQHKNDDSGYYSKDGDIEGRFKPKVVSESEHTEYINPKLQYNARYNGYDNGRMTTYGQLDSNDNSYVTNGHGGYGSQAIGLSAANMGSSSNQAYSGSYGMSSGHQTYGSAKLRTLTNRLQEELTRQMQDTIYDQMSTGGYSSMSVSQKMQLLENELRRNLTDRMRNELQNEYGTQSIRGGQSYSIHGGHVESTANYDNQELADLTNQIETNLLNSLRENYRQYESRQSSSSHNSHSSSNMYMTTTTYRPYTHQTTYRNIYPALNNEYSSSQYNSQSSKIHYGPIQNPVSITNVVSNVQTDLNQKVNDMLMDVRQKYFSQNTHGLTNYDVLLDRLKNELRSNITLYIDEAIRRNYGQQQLKDGYMYSVGPNGQYSTNYNYNSRDLENLQRQLESNLLEKLNREFQTYQTRYEQSYGTSGSSSSMTSGSHNYGTTYGSDNYSNRPSSPNLAPLVSSGIKGNNNYYGSRGSYEANSASSSATIMQLQRQLQEQLSRQLQAAIRQNQYQYSGQTSSSNPQAYQLSYQQLSEELSRNLTRQLQEAMSSSNYQGSSSYSYGGSSLNDQQFANLKSTLQNELSRELQQGLSQSWSSHSSWSASSGYSTNYRPTRDSNNNYYSNGQYRSGAMIEGADCDHDDANPHTSHRHRRHIGRYYGRYNGQEEVGQQEEEEEDLGQVTENALYSSNNNYQRRQYQYGTTRDINHGFNNNQRRQYQYGTTQDINHFSHQSEGNSHYNQQQEVGQQEEEDENLGQTEDVGQEEEKDVYGKLEIGSQRKPNEDNFSTTSPRNKPVSTRPNSHIINGQQILDDSFEQLHVGETTEKLVGQQEEEEVYLRPIPKYKQNIDQTEYVGQEEEEDVYGKLEIGSQHKPIEDNFSTTSPRNKPVSTRPTSHIINGQQILDDSFEQLHVGETTEKLVGQQEEEEVYLRPIPKYKQNIDQTEYVGQEEEEDVYGKLEIGSQHKPIYSRPNNQRIKPFNVVNKPLNGQQTEDSFEQLHVGQTQEQQTEGFGKIELTPKPATQQISQSQTFIGQEQTNEESLNVEPLRKTENTESIATINSGSLVTEKPKKQIEEVTETGRSDINIEEVTNKNNRTKDLPQQTLNTAELGQQEEIQTNININANNNLSTDSNTQRNQQSLSQAEKDSQMLIEFLRKSQRTNQQDSVVQENSDSGAQQVVQQFPVGNMGTYRQTNEGNQFGYHRTGYAGRQEIHRVPLGYQPYVPIGMGQYVPTGIIQQPNGNQDGVSQQQMPIFIVPQPTPLTEPSDGFESYHQNSQHQRSYAQVAYGGNAYRGRVNENTNTQNSYNNLGYNSRNQYSSGRDQSQFDQTQNAQNSYNNRRYNSGSVYTSKDQSQFITEDDTVASSTSKLEALDYHVVTPQYLETPTEKIGVLPALPVGQTATPIQHGFKTRYRPQYQKPQVPQDGLEPEAEIIAQEETAAKVEEVPVVTEKPGFWKRFGNKIKTGAESIKEKIGL